MAIAYCTDTDYDCSTNVSSGQWITVSDGYNYSHATRKYIPEPAPVKKEEPVKKSLRMEVDKCLCTRNLWS